MQPLRTYVRIPVKVGGGACHFSSLWMGMARTPRAEHPPEPKGSNVPGPARALRHTRRVPLRAALIALAAVCTLLAACGERDEPETADGASKSATSTADADPEDVQVITDWSEALTAGDIEAAA